MTREAAERYRLKAYQRRRELIERTKLVAGYVLLALFIAACFGP